MELTDEERCLVLAGLFELRITHLADDLQVRRITELAKKIGGDPDEMFFESS